MSTVSHANQSGLDLHEDKRIKQSVRAASTANVSLSAPGSTLDGVTLVAGDRVLLKDQTTASQNGLYTWSGAAVALVRTNDANAATLLFHGFKLFVREGTANAATYWTFTQTATVTLETTALSFAKDGAGSGSVTSVAVTVPSDLSVIGSPITSSGTIAISANTQSANTVKAGPSSGAAAAPGYRALVPADLPTMVASGASHAGGAVPDPGASAGTTRFLREDATFAVPAGAGAGGSGTPLSSSLSADVTLTSANTFFDGPSVTVGAGSWLLVASVLAIDTLGTTAFTAKLWDGTTVIDSTESTIPFTNFPEPLPLVGIVSPAASTTYKVSVATTSTPGAGHNGVIKAAAPANGAGNNASTLIAIPVFGFSQSATAAAVATSGTITTSGVTSARVSPTGAVTGVILQAGTYAGQRCNVINEAVAANSVTFAASGTSNVADGTSDVIAGLTARLFVWDTGVSLWFPCK